MNVNFFKNMLYRPSTPRPTFATPKVTANSAGSANPFDQMNWSASYDTPRPTGLKALALNWLLKVCRKLQAPSVSQSGFLAPAISEVFRLETLRDKQTDVDYVGGCNRRAKVAVIDSFSYDSETKLHGDHVVGVLQREGDLRPSELQRVRFSCGQQVTSLLDPGPESPEARLNGFIQQDSYFSLKDKCKILRDLKMNPNLQIINMSIGIDAFGTTNYLYRKALRDKDKPTAQSEFLFKAVDLPHSYEPENLKKLWQRLMNRVQGITACDPMVAGARREFHELTSRLKESGVSLVVAAGNDGQHARQMQAEGYEIPDGALVSDFQSADAVVVGAIDDKGTPSTLDDTLAPFTTPSPYTRYLANGTHVDVDAFGGGTLMSGTSFAAPIVAGKIAKARRQHPDAPPESISYLIARPVGVPGSNLPVVGGGWV